MSEVRSPLWWESCCRARSPSRWGSLPCLPAEVPATGRVARRMASSLRRLETGLGRARTPPSSSLRSQSEVGFVSCVSPSRLPRGWGFEKTSSGFQFESVGTTFVELRDGPALGQDTGSEASLSAAGRPPLAGTRALRRGAASSWERAPRADSLLCLYVRAFQDTHRYRKRSSMCLWPVRNWHLFVFRHVFFRPLTFWVLFLFFNLILFIYFCPMWGSNS